MGEALTRSYVGRFSKAKLFLLIFLPLLLLLNGGLLSLYLLHDRENQSLARSGAWTSVHVADKMMRIVLESVVSDLQWLASCQEGKCAFKGNMPQGAQESLLEFVRSKRQYDQLRYLDITGMEVFRINWNFGEPYIVPSKGLQFKGGRQFFAQGLKLVGGDVYISPFDLNIEHGRLERPLKPVIRFATPVIDADGNRLGLVVLNFLGQRLLTQFGQTSNANGEWLMLLNKDGYWLKASDPAREWGFMFDDRRSLTFKSLHAKAWSMMMENPSGQFFDREGLYTFATLSPAEVIVTASSSKPEHAADSWRIVSYIPSDAYRKDNRRYLGQLALVGAPGSLFMAALALLMVHYFKRSQSAEQAIIAHDASFARFVPKEFLRLVGKGSLLDVELSTSVQRDLTVLFSDIRSYTTLSEGMTHEEVFTFLNEYFVCVSGPVGAHAGFIDIFIGDALMALFPNSPQDALRSAVDMRRDLRAFNERRKGLGMQPVRCGYGLHHGGVTLGTIGTYERMQTTAIGDTVNLASRIESVTKTFKVDIVISGDVYSRLSEPGEFRLREIDTVRVKGKNEPVTLYECFDADPPALAMCKIATQDALAEGLAAYKAGDFDSALEKFTACAEACPEDSIPPIYIKRCNTMKRIPPGDGWAGISTL